MKKIIVLAVILTASFGLRAQTLSALAAKYAKTEKVEEVHLTKDILMGMILQSAKQSDGNNPDEGALEEMKKQLDEGSVFKDLEELYILSFENCSTSARKKFCSEASEATEDGLELLMSANEDGNHVKIFASMEDGRCKDLIILSLDPKEPAIVRMKGNIKMKDIGNVLGQINLSNDD